MKDKIFHCWNRFYLLITVCLSLLLPLASINISSGGADQENIAKVLQTISLQYEFVIEIGGKSPLSSRGLLGKIHTLICGTEFLKLAGFAARKHSSTRCLLFIFKHSLRARYDATSID